MSNLTPERREIISDYLSVVDPNAQRHTYWRSYPVNEVCLYPISEQGNAEATVLVPFDADDDVEALSHTLSELDKAGADEQPTEVRVAFNSDALDNNDPNVSALNGAMDSDFRILLNYLKKRRAEDFPNILLSLQNTHIPARHNMNAVWRHCLGTTLLASIGLQRPGNYAIHRFDADANEIQRGTLPAMTQAVRERRAHLVKAVTRFGWTGGRPENVPRTQIEHVSHIYGHAKELIEAKLGEHEERIYHEESGSGATIDTWMRVMAAEQREVAVPSSKDCENRIFLRRAKKLLDPNIAPFVYLPSSEAGHSTSDRRITKLLEKKYRAWQLPMLNEETPYRTYVELCRGDGHEAQREHPTVAYFEEVAQMIGILWQRQEEACGHPITLSRAAKQALGEDIARGNFESTGMVYYDDSAKNQRIKPDDWVKLARVLGGRALRDANAVDSRSYHIQSTTTSSIVPLVAAGKHSEDGAPQQIKSIELAEQAIA